MPKTLKFKGTGKALTLRAKRRKLRPDVIESSEAQ